MKKLKVSIMGSFDDGTLVITRVSFIPLETITEVVVAIGIVFEKVAGRVVVPDDATHVFPLLVVQVVVHRSFGEINV
jgi:hypothetical protein